MYALGLYDACSSGLMTGAQTRQILVYFMCGVFLFQELVLGCLALLVLYAGVCAEFLNQTFCYLCLFTCEEGRLAVFIENVDVGVVFLDQVAQDGELVVRGCGVD